MSRVIVFTTSKLNIRKGGPSGYVANLRLSLGAKGKEGGIEVLSGSSVETVLRIIRPMIFWSSRKDKLLNSVKQWLLLKLICLKKPKVIICNSVEDFCLVNAEVGGYQNWGDVSFSNLAL